MCLTAVDMFEYKAVCNLKGLSYLGPITSCTVGRRSQGIAAFRNLLPRRANPKNAGGCAIRMYGSVCNVHICRRTKATTPTDAAA